VKEVGRGTQIFNKTMTLADTEYSQAIPYGTAKLLVQCRGAYDVKLSFSDSTNNYFTLKSGAVYYEDMIDTSARTLYFQCATAAQVLEILVWVR
jgi:hypothetical protein